MAHSVEPGEFAATVAVLLLAAHLLICVVEYIATLVSFLFLPSRVRRRRCNQLVKNMFQLRLLGREKHRFALLANTLLICAFALQICLLLMCGTVALLLGGLLEGLSSFRGGSWGPPLSSICVVFPLAILGGLLSPFDVLPVFDLFASQTVLGGGGIEETAPERQRGPDRGQTQTGQEETVSSHPTVSASAALYDFEFTSVTVSESSNPPSSLFHVSFFRRILQQSPLHTDTPHPSIPLYHSPLALLDWEDLILHRVLVVLCGAVIILVLRHFALESLTRSQTGLQKETSKRMAAEGERVTVSGAENDAVDASLSLSVLAPGVWELWASAVRLLRTALLVLFLAVAVPVFAVMPDRPLVPLLQPLPLEDSERPLFAMLGTLLLSAVFSATLGGNAAGAFSLSRSRRRGTFGGRDGDRLLWGLPSGRSMESGTWALAAATVARAGLGLALCLWSFVLEEREKEGEAGRLRGAELEHKSEISVVEAPAGLLLWEGAAFCCSMTAAVVGIGGAQLGAFGSVLGWWFRCSIFFFDVMTLIEAVLGLQCLGEVLDVWCCVTLDRFRAARAQRRQLEEEARRKEEEAAAEADGIVREVYLRYLRSLRRGDFSAPVAVSLPVSHQQGGQHRLRGNLQTGRVVRRDGAGRECEDGRRDRDRDRGRMGVVARRPESLPLLSSPSRSVGGLGEREEGESEEDEGVPPLLFSCPHWRLLRSLREEFGTSVVSPRALRALIRETGETDGETRRRTRGRTQGRGRGEIENERGETFLEAVAADISRRYPNLAGGSRRDVGRETGRQNDEIAVLGRDREGQGSVSDGSSNCCWVCVLRIARLFRRPFESGEAEADSRRVALLLPTDSSPSPRPGPNASGSLSLSRSAETGGGEVSGPVGRGGGSWFFFRREGGGPSLPPPSFELATMEEGFGGGSGEGSASPHGNSGSNSGGVRFDPSAASSVFSHPFRRLHRLSGIAAREEQEALSVSVVPPPAEAQAAGASEGADRFPYAFSLGVRVPPNPEERGQVLSSRMSTNSHRRGEEGGAHGQSSWRSVAIPLKGARFVADLLRSVREKEAEENRERGSAARPRQRQRDGSRNGREEGEAERRPRNRQDESVGSSSSAAVLLPPSSSSVPSPRGVRESKKAKVSFSTRQQEREGMDLELGMETSAGGGRTGVDDSPPHQRESVEASIVAPPFLDDSGVSDLVGALDTDPGVSFSPSPHSLRPGSGRQPSGSSAFSLARSQTGEGTLIAAPSASLHHCLEVLGTPPSDNRRPGVGMQPPSPPEGDLSVRASGLFSAENSPGLSGRVSLVPLSSSRKNTEASGSDDGGRVGLSSSFLQLPLPLAGATKKPPLKETKEKDSFQQREGAEGERGAAGVDEEEKRPTAEQLKDLVPIPDTEHSSPPPQTAEASPAPSVASSRNALFPSRRANSLNHSLRDGTERESNLLGVDGISAEEVLGVVMEVHRRGGGPHGPAMGRSVGPVKRMLRSLVFLEGVATAEMEFAGALERRCLDASRTSAPRRMSHSVSGRRVGEDGLTTFSGLSPSLQERQPQTEREGGRARRGSSNRPLPLRRLAGGGGGGLTSRKHRREMSEGGIEMNDLLSWRALTSAAASAGVSRRQSIENEVESLIPSRLNSIGQREESEGGDGDGDLQETKRMFDPAASAVSSLRPFPFPPLSFLAMERKKRKEERMVQRGGQARPRRHRRHRRRRRFDETGAEGEKSSRLPFSVSAPSDCVQTQESCGDLEIGSDCDVRASQCGFGLSSSSQFTCGMGGEERSWKKKRKKKKYVRLMAESREGSEEGERRGVCALKEERERARVGGEEARSGEEDEGEEESLLPSHSHLREEFAGGKEMSVGEQGDNTVVEMEESGNLPLAFAADSHNQSRSPLLPPSALRQRQRQRQTEGGEMEGLQNEKGEGERDEGLPSSSGDSASFSSSSSSSSSQDSRVSSQALFRDTSHEGANSVSMSCDSPPAEPEPPLSIAAPGGPSSVAVAVSGGGQKGVPRGMASQGLRMVRRGDTPWVFASAGGRRGGRGNAMTPGHSLRAALCEPAAARLGVVAGRGRGPRGTRERERPSRAALAEALAAGDVSEGIQADLHDRFAQLAAGLGISSFLLRELGARKRSIALASVFGTPLSV
uniref:Transmembrane protein n=1 Tax=Chromera velia CCMP2878 TaxID=1169474 RepID=A0A0G4FDP9_9ALVE|eukprot:Cvel_16416.t1-p1 / transcript=Cvel_16416.t1 / gene=Cvel_16416 / organism=Chromera_velia_CCMP2878 / gene_product=hypothetical protein / transcript_product=hypothetical protein / location=Cvel_scaffold1264:1817-10005(-) / protein_length=2129 / sequence_SO=supercontig / SO=protein_coding / is_pseudo=false